MLGGVGKLTGTRIKLNTDEQVRPLAQPLIRTPYQTQRQGNVEAEIEHLLDLDIIDPVKNPTTWVNPIVVVHKANRNDIRICVDKRRTNEDILRERHLISTIDEVLQNMQGSKMFSKPDLIMGYHQLELDPESRIITTFSTHLVLYRYKLLLFGVKSAAE